MRIHIWIFHGTWKKVTPINDPAKEWQFALTQSASEEGWRYDSLQSSEHPLTETCETTACMPDFPGFGTWTVRAALVIV